MRGRTYTLRTVGGAALPARFSPFGDPGRTATARIDSGKIAFDTAAALGTWYGVGGSGTAGRDVDVIRVLQSGYVQDGARVLIYGYVESTPDTAMVSGDTLTVRAHLAPRPSQDHDVVLMVYAR